MTTVGELSNPKLEVYLQRVGKGEAVIRRHVVANRNRRHPLQHQDRLDHEPGSAVLASSDIIPSFGTRKKSSDAGSGNAATSAS